MASLLFKKKSKGETNTPEKTPLDGELTSENIQKILANSNDVIYQTHYINGRRDIPVCVVFVEGLVDIKILNDDIQKPLTQERALDMRNVSGIIDQMLHGTIYHGSRNCAHL